MQLGDREYFFRFLRMSPERLENLLEMVGPLITKKPCRSREAITPAERLVITLRYLATGDSQQSQSFNFRVGRATVCKIVKETCNAIWLALSEKYLKAPQTVKEWLDIAMGFENEWNFPNCLGAIDGKHIAIECPKKAGSMFFNYKSFHSTVLMACCDANYCFTFVDIGSYGRDNDASIFGETQLSKYFETKETNIPGPKTIDGYNLHHVLVSDEIFPLKPWLMKPYPGKGLTESQAIFNYRLSRARRTIENTFRVLSARWRIFRRPIRANPDTVDKIVQATVCLHNYLRVTENAHYIPKGFVDSENNSGEIIPGDWRATIFDERTVGHGALQRMGYVGSNTYTNTAKNTRILYEKYFNSSKAALSWQIDHVRSCGKQIEN